MALDSQTSDILGAPDRSRFVEFGWIEGDLAWCEIALMEESKTPGGDPETTRIAKMAWPRKIGAGGGYRPVWWQLIEAPRLPKDNKPTQPDTLLLVLSPDVELVEPRPLPRGAIGHRSSVNFEIVRANSRADVPQRGEPLRPGMFEPVSTFVRAEYDPQWSVLPTSIAIQPQRGEMRDELKAVEFVGLEGVAESGDRAKILRKPGSCVVTHEAPGRTSWRVDVTHEDPTKPGSFSVEVTGLPRPGNSLYISHYHVRIVTCGSVHVRAAQSPLDNLYLSDDPNPFDIHVSHVTVEHAVMDDQSVMPFTGWVVAHGRGFREIAPYATRPASQTFAINMMVSAIEMIPVVGSIIEIGGVVYAAGTGRTWYGDEVTDGDLALMGVFALLGVLPGVSSGMLKELSDAGGSLMPGAPLISMNPGLVQQARAFLRNGPRLLRDFVDYADDTVRDEMFTLLKTSLKSGARRPLADALGELLMPVLLNADMIDDIPESHLIDQMRRIAIESLPAFDELSPDDAEHVTKLFRFATDATDVMLLKGTLEEMGHSVLWSEFYETARDAIVFRLFTSDFSAVRDPTLAGEMVYRSLFEDFATYSARKAKQSKTGRAALEWLDSLNGDALAARMMEGEFGINWRAMLRPYVDGRRYAVSSSQASEFRKFLSDILPYREFRDLVSGRGFGMLFQVDHILEQRFLKYLPEQFTDGTDDFLGFLVPWNQTVANNLALHGVTDFLYVHAEKTEMLRQLIPYGYEGMFTTQEYWYVYQYVYIKKFGFTGTDNAQSLFGLFEQMNQSRLAAGMAGEVPIAIDLIAAPDKLFAKIVAAHNRLNLVLTTPP